MREQHPFLTPGNQKHVLSKQDVLSKQVCAQLQNKFKVKTRAYKKVSAHLKLHLLGVFWEIVNSEIIRDFVCPERQTIALASY